jgi:hypothetical protein
MKPIDLLNYDKSVIIRNMLICREKIRQQQTLIRNKQKQAELMIELCNNRIKSNGKKYSDRDYKIANIFSTINKRGERSDKLSGILPTIL